MSRGKIEIKRIGNLPTDRLLIQNEEMVFLRKHKKSQFSVIQRFLSSCSLNTGEFHEFVSPTTTNKNIFDQYQNTRGIYLWETHYERMQETYKKLKDVNDKLRKQIRQRIGEDLDDLSMDELHSLEQKMTAAADAVRERKYHVIKTQTDTYKKKEAQYEDPNLNYGLVDGGEYQSAATLSNGASNLYAFHLYNANFPQGGGGFGPNNLSLGRLYIIRSCIYNLFFRRL